jgi:hypothetical protein
VSVRRSLSALATAARASVARSIAFGLAGAACVAAAVLFATGSISGARTPALPSGPSPACIPAHAHRSAMLADTRLTVSPGPESAAASPTTQISFLGTRVSDISNVAVEGSRSGYHRGRLYGYFQRDGGSFVPDKPFRVGESVRVRALLDTRGRARTVSWTFEVATPYPTNAIAQFANAPAPSSAVQSFQTAPNMHPPTLSVTTADRDPNAGEVMMTVGPGPGQYGPLIYRPDGALVWFSPLGRGLVAEDLRVQSYEGASVLTWWQGKVLVLGFGQGEDVVMDSRYRTVARVRAGNGYAADLHDFQIVPGGVAYVTAYDVIRCDLTPVGGARNGVLVDTVVQAIDMKTGLVRWEWHSLGNVDVRESRAPVPKEPIPWDWFHLNSIDPHRDGTVLLSARSTWAAYEVAESTGAVLWRLGGTRSSFAMGAGTQTAWQHDARVLADGTVTMFDNGSNPRVHTQSRGVRLSLDTRRARVTLSRAYVHPQAPLLADSQGNMQTLADGNELVGWGAIPSVSEFAPDGTMLFDAHMPPGTASYRAFRFRWSARPQSPPVASARVLATEDETSVFASWNGATDVASWRVLAGPTPHSLTAQATAPSSGFESTITYPENYAERHVEYVAVQALDARGAVLATSPAVATAPPPRPPKS